MRRLVYCFIFLIQSYQFVFLWSNAVIDPEPVNPYDYGVDYTFPMQHYQTRDNFFKQRYDKWMSICYNASSQPECDACERSRLEITLHQPQEHINFTKLGFRKGKVPEYIFKDILAFYEKHKTKGKKIEPFDRGNTYVNFWAVPTYMINFEDKQLHGGQLLRDRILTIMNPILSKWIGGRKLETTSIYGIRVYQRDSYLATHVDRMPLVTSAVIQVAQDVDEPWPIEIIGHDGKAYNVTMEPGEMILYESHTTLHGRPFPLNGSFYANVFVHFRPIGYDSMQKLFLRDKAAGLNVSHYGHPHTIINESDTSSSNHTGTKAVIHKLSGSNKEKGGHQHDQHDEETLKRHIADIEKENAKKKEMESKKIVSKDKKKVHTGNEDAIE